MCSSRWLWENADLHGYVFPSVQIKGTKMFRNAEWWWMQVRPVSFTTVKGFTVCFSECFTPVIYGSWMHRQGLLITGALFSSCRSVLCCFSIKYQGGGEEALLCHKGSCGSHQEFFCLCNLISIKLLFTIRQQWPIPSLILILIWNLSCCSKYTSKLPTLGPCQHGHILCHCPHWDSCKRLQQERPGDSSGATCGIYK